jgi:hypothetical protein
MGFIPERLIRLFRPSKSVEELAVQVEDLRHTLNSALHDLVVMKSILEEEGLMDAALYKQLRIRRMISDHGGPGPSSWKYMSIYPYTLEEKDFLREALDATEAEVKGFEEDAAHATTLT